MIDLNIKVVLVIPAFKAKWVNTLKIHFSSYSKQKVVLDKWVLIASLLIISCSVMMLMMRVGKARMDSSQKILTKVITLCSDTHHPHLLSGQLVRAGKETVMYYIHMSKLTLRNSWEKHAQDHDSHCEVVEIQDCL